MQFCTPAWVSDGSTLFLGCGKSSVGCGNGGQAQKGAIFPMVKQSVCNYIRADCVQRKCVCPESRSWALCRGLYVCVCICYTDEGRMWTERKLPPLADFMEVGRAAAVGPFD